MVDNQQVLIFGGRESGSGEVLTVVPRNMLCSYDLEIGQSDGSYLLKVMNFWRLI